MKKTLLAMALVLLCSVPSFAGSGELYLYIWSEYIPDEVVENFTKETGITVNISTYDSNEAMYAKIKLAGEGYDLIVPSSDYVGLMRRQDMLLPLDKSRLTNFINLAPQFLDQPFDPDNTFSIPYMWGSTSIAVNTAIIDADDVASLEDLWKPELNDRLLLPNDPREVFGLALLSMGYSINDTDPEHLEKAYRKLEKLMPSVRVFDSDSPKQALLSGEVTIGVIWNGEAYIANQENPEIQYIYPTEGLSLWMDSLCIPKGAKNLDEAYTFLNYLLRPDVAAAISSELGYSTPNAKALEILPEDVRSNTIVYPTADITAHGEFQDDVGDTTKTYQDYWMRLKEMSK